MAIRYLTDHRLAYAMEKSVVGNTAEAVLISERITVIHCITDSPIVNSFITCYNKLTIKRGRETSSMTPPQPTGNGKVRKLA